MSLYGDDDREMLGECYDAGWCDHCGCCLGCSDCTPSHCACLEDDGDEDE